MTMSEQSRPHFPISRTELESHLLSLRETEKKLLDRLALLVRKDENVHRAATNLRFAEEHLKLVNEVYQLELATNPGTPETADNLRQAEDFWEEAKTQLNLAEVELELEISGFKVKWNPRETAAVRELIENVRHEMTNIERKLVTIIEAERELAEKLAGRRERALAILRADHAVNKARLIKETAAMAEAKRQKEQVAWQKAERDRELLRAGENDSLFQKLAKAPVTMPLPSPTKPLPVQPKQSVKPVVKTEVVAPPKPAPEPHPILAMIADAKRRGICKDRIAIK